MNDWFETEWAGIAQVFRLCRHTQDGENVRKETVYGVTNLPRKKANASRLLALQQAHWHIENRLHWRRDVALMDWLQVSNVASQMRHFCAHPQDALQLLFCTLLR
jgi:predicted transposase YbfD/YdcC